MATSILAAVGPYSPIAGPDSLTFCGGIVGLAKRYGVDIVGVTDDRSRVQEAEDQDGHTWYIRSLEFHCTAFRDRTAEELEALKDEHAERFFCEWFSSERLRYSRAIGRRVRWLIDAQRPEHGQSRQARRDFKKQASALLDVQLDLMSSGTTKLAEVRKRVEPFGLLLGRVA